MSEAKKLRQQHIIGLPLQLWWGLMAVTPPNISVVGVYLLVFFVKGNAVAQPISLLKRVPSYLCRAMLAPMG